MSELLPITTLHIEIGHVCMKCVCLLIGPGGKQCECGHPVLCVNCWRKLTLSEKDSGVPYFDHEAGEVFAGLEAC